MKNVITKSLIAGILLVFSANLISAAPPLITSVKQLSQNVREDIVNKSTTVATIISSITVLQTDLAIETTTRIAADAALTGGINSNAARIGQLELATATLRTDLDAVILSTGSFIEFETDPVFSAAPAAGILAGDITNWNTSYSWGDHALAGYLTTETDPIFTAAPAAGILAGDITNWNTAYGWGNHALAGYLTSYTETDPIFSAAPAAGILADDIAEWGEAYDWGDHALAGYVTTSDSPTWTGGHIIANNSSGIVSLSVESDTELGSRFEIKSSTLALRVRIGGLEGAISTQGRIIAKNNDTWLNRVVLDGRSDNGEIYVYKTGTVLDSYLTADATTNSYLRKGGGNLGIGTDAPAAKLDVAGSIGFHLQTSAQIKATDPTKAGETLMCTDCAIPYSLCVSTGTAVNDWAKMGTTDPCE